MFYQTVHRCYLSYYCSSAIFLLEILINLDTKQFLNNETTFEYSVCMETFNRKKNKNIFNIYLFFILKLMCKNFVCIEKINFNRIFRQ